MREKIALWGYGKYGKWHYDNIQSEWSQEYQITIVFDKNLAGQMTKDQKLIMNPASLAVSYAEGMFSSVLLGVGGYRKNIQDTILKTLRKLNIPECVLDNRKEFHPVQDFLHDKTTSLNPSSFGYKVDILRDLYFFRPFYDQKCYLYDNKGQLLTDLWYDYEFLQEPLITSFRPDVSLIDVPELKGDYCLLARCYSQNYWHFIYQSMDLAWALEKRGYQGKYIIPSASFAKPLMKLIGVTDDRLVDVEEMGYLKPTRLERVYVVSQGDGRYNPQKSAPVLLNMRDEMIAQVVANDCNSFPERVFVKRGNNRRLQNVDTLLKKYKFVSIDPEKLTIPEQIRYFNNARIVISPHGANSANSLFMQPGSVMIETFPNNYIQPLCLETIIRGGVRYLEVVESRTQVRFSEKKKQERDYNADYMIDEALLEQTIQNALSLVYGSE